MKGIISRIFKIIAIIIYLIFVWSAGYIIYESINTSRPIKSAWVWCQYDNKIHEAKPTSLEYSLTDYAACDYCRKKADINQKADINHTVLCKSSDLGDGSYKINEIIYEPIDNMYIYSAMGVIFGGWLAFDFIIAIIFYIIEGKFTLTKGIYFKIFKLFSRKK